jgi:hypothetical protein
MNTNKITQDEYLEFITNYDPYKNRDVRFGQAFCNEFNITDPELFHEWDDAKAGELMMNHVESDQ